jgi:uncharacterized OB-fold protein
MSMFIRRDDPARCPNCGETVTPYAAGCWLCGERLEPWRRQRAPGPLERLATHVRRAMARRRGSD